MPLPRSYMVPLCCIYCFCLYPLIVKLLHLAQVNIFFADRHYYSPPTHQNQEIPFLRSKGLCKGSHCIPVPMSVFIVCNRSDLENYPENNYRIQLGYNLFQRTQLSLLGETHVQKQLCLLVSLKSSSKRCACTSVFTVLFLSWKNCINSHWHLAPLVGYHQHSLKSAEDKGPFPPRTLQSEITPTPKVCF